MGTEGDQGLCLRAKCESWEQTSPCAWVFALGFLSRFIGIKHYLDAYPDFLVSTTAVFIIYLCIYYLYYPWKRTLNFLELSLLQ